LAVSGIVVIMTGWQEFRQVVRDRWGTGMLSAPKLSSYYTKSFEIYNMCRCYIVVVQHEVILTLFSNVDNLHQLTDYGNG